MTNEKRLIDANELLKDARRNKAIAAFLADIGDIQDLINDQPTVDAVSRGVHEQVRWERDVAIEQLESYGVSLGEKAEVAKVVHGRWVSLTDCSNAGVYCSVCNKKVYKEDYAWCNRKNKLRSNYCPNCGAKMDGDGNV